MLERRCSGSRGVGRGEDRSDAASAWAVDCAIQCVVDNKMKLARTGRPWRQSGEWRSWGKSRFWGRLEVGGVGAGGVEEPCEILRLGPCAEPPIVRFETVAQPSPSVGTHAVNPRPDNPGDGPRRCRRSRIKGQLDLPARPGNPRWFHPARITTGSPAAQHAHARPVISSGAARAPKDRLHSRLDEERVHAI